MGRLELVRRLLPGRTQAPVPARSPETEEPRPAVSGSRRRCHLRSEAGVDETGEEKVRQETHREGEEAVHETATQEF